MNKFEKEEQKILESYEKDEWSSSKNISKEKLKYSQVAKNTYQKNMRINIRLSERDLTGLKQKSLEEGIPYQTLVSSVLHKYVNGRLVEQSKKTG